MGIEPVTFWLPVKCSNHWATQTQMESVYYENYNYQATTMTQSLGMFVTFNAKECEYGPQKYFVIFWFNSMLKAFVVETTCLSK